MLLKEDNYRDYEEQKELEKKICSYIEEEYYKNNTNIIIISKNNLKDLKIQEVDASRILLTLESDSIMEIIKKPVAEDFSMSWKIKISSIGIEYFKDLR